MLSRLPVLMSRLAFVLAGLAGVALLYMMTVTVADIVGRTLGLFTIDSGVEQAELLMAAIAFFGLARCFSVEGNIVVDIATGHLPDHINRLIDAFWHLVAAAVVTLLAYLVLRNGIAADKLGQRSELLGLSPLLGHGIAALGMAVAVLMALIMAVASFARGGRSSPDI
jgi:TRAP-type C4-dicarboxylate transport system permease small subunit